MKLRVWLSLFLVSLSSLALRAQTQGNLPNLKDSAIDSIGGGTHGVITWPEDIVVNDTIVLCINTDQNSGPFAIIDTLANTWTCTSPTRTPLPEINGYANMCYTKSSSAGADTITYSIPGHDGQMVGGRFIGLGAVDGVLQTATDAGNGLGGTGSISTTSTTTVNNDLGISCAGISTANTGFRIAPTTGELVAHEATVSTYPTLTMFRTGTLGSQTVTDNIWNGPDAFLGGHTTFAMQTLMFSPAATIALADTALPHAASGVTYEADLHCVGGVAAQNYTLVSGSLPTGLSLSSSTGKITGSTSVLGTTSLGFTCDDGSTTSATDTLALTVDPSFGVPFIRFYTTSFTGTTASIPVATCGDVIVLPARGNDTAHDSGWVQSIDGVNNKAFDSFGSPVQRLLLPMAGPPQTPIEVYVFGPLAKTGTDVIHVVNNQGANSGLPPSGVFVLGNVQGVVDQGNAFNDIIDSGTLTNTYVSTTPNTFLISAATDLQANQVGLSASLGAPFTLASGGGGASPYSIYGSALIASPGTTTLTTTVTGSGEYGEWSSLVIPFRAGNTACPTLIRHRSWFQQ